MRYGMVGPAPSLGSMLLLIGEFTSYCNFLDFELTLVDGDCPLDAVCTQPGRSSWQFFWPSAPESTVPSDVHSNDNPAPFLLSILLCTVSTSDRLKPVPLQALPCTLARGSPSFNAYCLSTNHTKQIWPARCRLMFVWHV